MLEHWWLRGPPGRAQLLQQKISLGSPFLETLNDGSKESLSDATIARVKNQPLRRGYVPYV